MVDRAENQRDYWNGVASYYDSKYGYETTKGCEKLCRKAQSIMGILGLRSGDKVLELGCGTGTYTNYLHRAGINVSGVDVSDEMLSVAKSKNPAIEYYKSDVHKMPFKDNEYDAIVGFYILQYVNVPQVLNEVYRILKYNGKVGFIEPNVINPLVFAKTKVNIIKKVNNISSEASSFCGYELCKLFKKHFKDVEIRYIEYGCLKCVSALIKPVAGSLIVNGIKR